MKDLYTENYKTISEIEDDSKKWKDIPCSWNEELALLKWLYQPNQRSRIAKAILKKKNKAGGTAFPNFSQY